MKIVNLTPHAINEVATGKKFPASGQVARVSTQYTQQGDIDGIPLFRVQYVGVEGLPPKKRGVRYIVSSLVLEALRGQRKDLIAPGDLIRDYKGDVIGCGGFKK